MDDSFFSPPGAGPKFEKELPPDVEFQQDLQAALDPRSKEFKELIKMTPATLAHYRTGGKWNPAEHLLYVAAILAHEITMGDARIIVEMPPRHGKSELCSVHTSTWFLEKFPWGNVMLTTYAADLATGFGRRVRDNFLLDETGFLDTRVRDDVQRTDLFQTTEGGGMNSVGIGGPITGRGAHLLLVDDYIKNWAEASSDLVLKSIQNWFATTAYTRLEPGGSCVILATRWVLNDLIGWLKEQDKEHMWTVISFPALAMVNDLLNRAPGEALWPKRYPKEKLEQIRRVIGEYMFQAMYQQDPKEIAQTKADVEQFRIIDQIDQPALWRWVRSWDTGATKEGGDWSVGSLVGTNARPGSSVATTCIHSMVREQLGPAGLEKLMRETAEADGTDVPIVIEQEPGSSGKIAAAHIATNVLRGFNVTTQPPGGNNKWVRAQPYIAAVTNGRCCLLRAAWNEIHKEELKKFPNGKHDDTVDSVAQGFNHLHQTNILVPTWGRDLDRDGQIGGHVIRGSTGPYVLVTGCVFGRRV